MNFDGFSEYAGQSLIVLAAMEALSALMAVLFCMTLAAFVIYLIGVWRLCRDASRCLDRRCRQLEIARFSRRANPVRSQPVLVALAPEQNANVETTLNSNVGYGFFEGVEVFSLLRRKAR